MSGRIATAVHALPGESLKLLYSLCTLKELRSLSSELTGAHEWAKNNLKLLDCHRGQRVLHADECIRDLIDSGQLEHHFVATQDQALQEFLANKKSVGLLFVSPNGIQLAPPSPAQLRLADQDVQQDMQATAEERQSGRELAADNPLRTSSKFKRKKPKGPNPMAVRRKAAQTPGKAKRPGPALRRALKQQAESELPCLATETKKKRRKRKRSKEHQA